MYRPKIGEIGIINYKNGLVLGTWAEGRIPAHSSYREHLHMYNGDGLKVRVVSIDPTFDVLKICFADLPEYVFYWGFDGENIIFPDANKIHRPRKRPICKICKNPHKDEDCPKLRTFTNVVP